MNLLPGSQEDFSIKSKFKGYNPKQMLEKREAIRCRSPMHICGKTQDAFVQKVEDGMKISKKLPGRKPPEGDLPYGKENEE